MDSRARGLVGQDPALETPMPMASTRSTTGPRQRVLSGAGCDRSLVLGQVRVQEAMATRKMLAPSGNKNRRADVACFTSNWSCGVVGSSWSGQCRCNGLEGLEGMGGREGQARRFFCSSSTGRERNGRNKEDPGQGAQRNNGRTGCQTEPLGWRVGQMINTYMANEPGNMSCPSSCPGPESG